MAAGIRPAPGAEGTDVTVTLCTPSACAGLQAASASAGAVGRGQRCPSQVGVSACKSVAVLGSVYVCVGVCR